MIVRPANGADLPTLAPMFDAYRQFYGQPADLARAGAFLAERFLRAESVVLMAFDGDNALGFTQLYPSFSSVRAAQLMILNDLYVDPARRRSGVGEALVRAAVDHAQGQGATGLVLQTGADNAAAQALYERLGWTRQSGFYEYGLRLA
jgi:ribosomal protein S18 acetylase RimI-like enzyme